MLEKFSLLNLNLIFLFTSSKVGINCIFYRHTKHTQIDVIMRMIVIFNAVLLRCKTHFQINKYIPLWTLAFSMILYPSIIQTYRLPTKLPNELFYKIVQQVGTTSCRMHIIHRYNSVRYIIIYFRKYRFSLGFHRVIQ